MKLALALAAAVFLFSACSSPEARRTRGGGPGADVGNRQGNVEIHAGSDVYWQTPKLIPSQSPPLDTARHARNLDLAEAHNGGR